jgi:hypothetical protein
MQAWPDEKPRAAMLSDVRAWMAQVDVALAGNEARRDAFAEALARSGDLTTRRMFDILRDGKLGAGTSDNLLSACLRKDEERACHRIAQRIRWNFIYPVRERSMNIGLNDAALDRAEQDLCRATTRSDINAALQRLEDDYKVAGFKSLKELSPVIPKLRTYYLSI